MGVEVLTDQETLASARKGGHRHIVRVVQAVKEALRQGKRALLERFLQEEHPADIAFLIKRLEPSEAADLLLRLDPAKRAETFSQLSGRRQRLLSQELPRPVLVGLISDLKADRRADFFKHLPEKLREVLLPALAQAKREDIRRLAGYAEETAGALMTSEYAVLAPHLTARQALERLRHEAPDKETIYRTYVVDEQRRLIGSLRLQTLILAAPQATIADLMERNPKRAHVNDDQEEVARQIARYDLIALPVVDDAGRLVGIVTHDDAVDVVHQEATEDMHKVGSLGRITTSVREAGIGLLYRRRIVWLVLLIFGNLLSGAGIAFFEATIAAHIGLVFFLPLLVGSGGNAGSQAATLVVRGLATGEVVLRDWSRMLGRELLVAGLLGLTMAFAVSGIGLLRGGPELALLVSATMVLIVLIGSLIGLSLPFLLNRLSIDPATASAPLVTSLCDAVGVALYFGMATLLLEMPLT